MWSSELKLILSCTAIAIGMANIWRFPKVLYENGGGAFLMAYMVALVAVGYPLFYLELILGQYTRLGPGAVTRCVPMARGVEVCAGLLSLLMSSYLQALLAQSLLQLILAFTDFNLVQLSGCHGFWEQQMETCFRAERRVCGSHYRVPHPLRKGQRNRSSLPLHVRPFKYDDVVMDCVNVTETMSEHFFHTSVGLRSHRQVWSVGGLHVELLLCLALMWVLLFVCLASGLPPVHHHSAAHRFDDAADDRDDLERRAPPWASGSCSFLAGGICFRSRVVFMVTLLTLAASLMYAIIVFSSLGSMALSLNIPVKDVVHGGQGYST
ncbi:hypothetical protein MTO96_042433 [Rhipicephalus appendiculatus]